MNVTKIISVDKKERLVWIGILLSRAATDRDTKAIEQALKEYGIDYREVLTAPSGRLGQTADQITISVPYPAHVFGLPEKYEIFKSAKLAIERIACGSAASGFQAKRLFCGDLAITQLFQQAKAEAANVG